MSRGASRRTPGGATPGAGSRARAAGCTVSVCRGCCCGTPKIPGVDHSGQLARLKQTLVGLSRVRATDCLDVCEHGNVIVVQPSAEGRAAGGRPVWLGLVNDPDAIEDITAWIRDGGPGLAEPPGVLDLYAFTPSRRIREALPGPAGAE